MHAIQYIRAAARGPIALCAAILFGLVITGCASDGPTRPGPGPRPDGPVVNIPPNIEAPDVAPITPPHMRDSARPLVRVALLLPFSARSAAARAEAASMLDAAELALFTRGHDRLILIPKDTEGTEAGARAAARAAIRDGADIILGPLFANAVTATSEEASAAGVPVIAFSNDRAAANGGAYLLSITPEAEVARLVEYATRNGVSNFYAFIPANEYGYRVRDALQTEASRSGGALVASESFTPGAGAASLSDPARALAAAIRGGGGPGSDGRPTSAVILPEGGVRLLSLAPLLAYNNVDPREVRFLGTSLWADESVVREPALQGGWYVAPDEEAIDAFHDDFQDSFNAEPSRLASLAYDAVALTSHLTDRAGAAGLTRDAIENQDGFFGADGLFRFRSDGTSEWGLAIYAIDQREFRLIEGAPQSFTPSGF